MLASFRGSGPLRLAFLLAGLAAALAAEPLHISGEAQTGDPPAATAKTDAATVSGRVLDSEGKPVPGSRVILGYPGRLTDLENQPTVAETTSDAQGGFAFQHLSPGRLSLGVEHEGFASLEPVEVEVPRTGKVDLGILTLDRGLAFEGRVIDPRGMPVPQVQVDLSPSLQVSSEDGIKGDFPRRTTDSEGRFRFDDLPWGERFDLSATSPGYLPASVQSVEVPAPGPLTITLKRGRSLSGRVTGPAGEPVPGAELELREESIVRTSLGEIKEGVERSLAATDGEGRFRAPGAVAPGTADLKIHARGYRSKRQSIQVPEDGDVEGLEISLEKPGVLEAHALDASGAPVPEADAELTRANSRDWRSWGEGVVRDCRTDAEGRCRIEGLDLEPGLYRLSVRSETRGHAEAVLELTSGVIARDLVLHKGVEVSGHGRDERGDPVPGAKISLRPAGMGPTLTASSSADGSFRFADVGDGIFRLSGSADGFAETQAPGEIRVAGQEVHGLDLRLSRGARVTGKLLGLDPEEARNATVAAYRPDLTSAQVLLGRVDPEGRYKIEDLGPGEWTVTAHRDGRSVAEPLHLASGVRETVLDLRFQTGFTVSGRVLLDHAPLAGMQVVVFTPARSSQALTGPDGGFRLFDLPAGHYNLMVLDLEGELGASKEVEIAADQEITFDIATGGLRGRVSAAGAPVAGALLHLVEDAAVAGRLSPIFPFGPALDGTTGGSGAFEIPRLPAGPYKITVEKEGFAPATVDVEVRPGAVAAVEIELRPAP
ncbi:MAG TPA: carboxypeptidase regulatory-like domain-containing protein [Thermoanaerobaculia bacterium]|nr:carboxypeptidase regulatory-like domain-containing protein [Thermoanaerobaculia bacterium]